MFLKSEKCLKGAAIRRIYFTFFVLLFILMGGYFSLNDFFISEEALVTQILEEQGYFSRVAKSGVPIEFQIKERWIPVKEGEQEINSSIADLYSSEIILHKARRTNNQISFEFIIQTKTKEQRKAGVFLHIDERMPNGIFKQAGPPEQWEFYDAEGQNLIYESKQMDGYGSGHGPGNQFSLSFDVKDRAMLKDQIKIKYSGLALYEYVKR